MTGKIHDARVFSNSPIYCKGVEGTLLPSWNKLINGMQVKLVYNSMYECSCTCISICYIPLLILRDTANPLSWLIMPYAVTQQTSLLQKRSNYCQSRDRMVIENTFSRLKGCWRCMLKWMDFQGENVPNIKANCVTLHNIII